MEDKTVAQKQSFWFTSNGLAAMLSDVDLNAALKYIKTTFGK